MRDEMSDKRQHDALSEDTPSVVERRTPWPPLPEPLHVKHVILRGTIAAMFTDCEPIRHEYVDPPFESPPRRGFLRRLFRRSRTDAGQRG